MSTFLDVIKAAARTSSHGMTTGEPAAPLHRTWGEVHQLARGVAAGLAAERGQRPPVVGVLAGEPVDIAPAVLGVWVAGGSVTMLHQPTPRTDLTVWQEDTVRATKMISAEVVLLGSPFEHLADTLRGQGIAVKMITEMLAAPPTHDYVPPPVGEDDAALFQLTSGSTAEPKAVKITHANVHANVTAMARGMEIERDADRCVSWAPMSHDMGMVGGLLIPMLTGMELVAITPTDFLREPSLWPELLSKYQATYTPGPNFSYAILAGQLERAEPGSLDLSHLRIAANSAEPVDPSTVDAFVAAGARFGLRPEAVNPCYGGAEITALATLCALDEPMKVDVVDAAELEENQRAVPVADHGAQSPDLRRLAFVGPALPGIEVRAVADSGAALGDREVGLLQIRGVSVTSGYVTPNGTVPTRDRDGWIDIGDEGYLVAGQVVVCGRRKDVIIMGGRNIYPADIERAASSVEGVRAGNVIAVRTDAGRQGARESFAVLAESRQVGEPAAERRIRAAIADRVAAQVGARPGEVVLLPPNRLPKTPSGKPRRSVARGLL